MADLPENPNNREEEYLADMAGENGTKPANPWSRKEAYLDAIDGRMDGIEEQIAALATDISLKGSVASQADLPETAAVGDAYITEDTGIMYVYVGESGTEPWVALGGSGGGDSPAKTLSSDDYDWPEDNPDGVALWKLPGGFYNAPVGVSVYIASNYSASTPATNNWAYFITKDNNRAKIINGSTNVNEQYVVNTSTGSEVTISGTSATNRSIIVGKMVVDNLTSTSVRAPLSANQGRVLKSLIDSGVKELTEADYNYPTDNPQAIAMWLLDSGYYKVKYTNGVQPKIIGGTSMSSTYEYNDGAILPIWDAFNAKVSIWSNYNAAGTLIKSYLVYSSGLGSYAYSQELSSPTVVQTTGTSTTSLMSQNATTSMVFADPGTNSKVRIGNTSNVGSNTICIGNGATGGGANNVAIGGTIESGVYTSVSIGAGASATSNFQEVAIGNNASCSGRGGVAIGSISGVTAGRGVAIGENARATYDGSVALGSNSSVSHIGEVNIGTSSSTQGYNGNSNYRLLTGLYDPQSAHDAATKGYVDGLISAIEARLTAGGL